MIANLEKIRELFEQEFDGNKTLCALELGISRSHVTSIINRGKGAGASFFGALYVYCKNKNLNFEDYVILPNINIG